MNSMTVERANHSGTARNLLEMLQATVQSRGNEPALYDPNEVGGYDVWTYSRFWCAIRCIASRLAQQGVGLRDMVGLLAESRAWWPISDFAIMSLGACTVPVYPSLPSEQVAFIIQNAAMKGIFLQDQKQLDKILQIPSGEIPSLEFIVVLEQTAGMGEGMSQVDGRYDVFSFSNWLKGLSHWDEATWSTGFAELHRDTLATIVYTSGTTGLPKGVMLTHGNLLANVEGLAQQFPVGPEDRSLSYLPLSHIFERTAGQMVMLHAGGSIAYSRGFSLIIEDFLKIPPTLFTTVPRLLEKVHEGVFQKLHSSPVWRRKLFQVALEWGMKSRVLKEPVSPWKVQLADRLVFAQIRQALGGHLHVVISGGAPLPRYIAEFFAAVGVPIAEGYGMTETSPVICVNPPDDIRYGTAGRVLPNVEVMIADDGEVLARGPSMAKGYYMNEEATRALYTEDGWLRTGDIGVLSPDRYLQITDRKKNLIVLSTGKKVMPAPLEEEILQSHYVDQVLMIGQGYKFISAIIVPNVKEVKGWFHRHDKHVPPLETWASDSLVNELLLREVKRTTDGYAEFERPKKVLVATDAFTVENGCLTPTLKVKAKAVTARYEREVKALYANVQTDAG